MMETIGLICCWAAAIVGLASGMVLAFAVGVSEEKPSDNPWFFHFAWWALGAAGAAAAMALRG